MQRRVCRRQHGMKLGLQTVLGVAAAVCSAGPPSVTQAKLMPLDHVLQLGSITPETRQTGSRNSLDEHQTRFSAEQAANAFTGSRRLLSQQSRTLELNPKFEMDVDVSLRSSQGSNLGRYLDAIGDVLLLGWTGEAMGSGHASRGSSFYVGTRSMDISEAGQDIRVVADQELSCFWYDGVTRCFHLNVTAPSEERAPWVETPPIDQAFWRICQAGSTSPCVGPLVTVSGYSIASAGVGLDGTRAVSILDLDFGVSNNGTWSWKCQSVCDANVTGGDGVIHSSESSFGESLAMANNIVAVGVPGAGSGAGSVEIWQGLDSGNGNLHTHQSWSRIQTLSSPGTVAFGQIVKLSSRLLVVGAPGDVNNNASLHIYQIDTASQDYSTHICSIYHPDPSLNSEFGASIAIQIGVDDAPDVVVVGAPGISQTYLILVYGDECVVSHTIRRGNYNAQDQLGFAVAVTQQYIFIGAPGYRGDALDQSPISGLLHVLTYCYPGQKSEWQLTEVFSYERKCQDCPSYYWSDGGNDQSCAQCTCNYLCETAILSPECRICDPLIGPNTRPDYSSWDPSQPTQCTWQCDIGYSVSGSACLPCPENAQDFNGVWSQRGSCDWTCLDTFFDDSGTTNPRCLVCSEHQSRVGVLAPVNSEWVDGLTECLVGPKIGYECNSSNPGSVLCTACDEKPQNAYWTQEAPALYDRCQYACNTGYFGHPDYTGICATCPEFMANITTENVLLPANAIWANQNHTCDASSWECLSGYYRSSSGNICCPSSIPNSSPSPGATQCDVVCDPGWQWNSELLGCEPCSDKPGNAEWIAGPTDCQFKCSSGYYGGDLADYRVCVICSEYQALKGNSPLNAIWDDNGGNCTDHDWWCQTGQRKSQDADPIGCCPIEPPVGAQVSEADVSTCGFKCLKGLTWDKLERKCINCPEDSILNEPESNAVWDGNPGQCRYICNSGYFAIPQDRPSECLDCPSFAARQEWTKPPNAVWMTSPELCNTTSWSCKEEQPFMGNQWYIRHPHQDKCCLQRDALVPTEHATLPGDWDMKQCQWRCNTGYFPTTPLQAWLNTPSRNCMTCQEYISALAIQLCPAGECVGQATISLPPACTVAKRMVWNVQGLSQSLFDQAVADIFRQAVADSLDRNLDDIKIVHVDVPRAGGTVGGAGASTLTSPAVIVAVQIDSIDPIDVADLSQMSISQQILDLESALGSLATSVSFLRYHYRYGRETWQCQSGLVHNPYNDECCTEVSEFPPRQPFDFRIFGDTQNGLQCECINCKSCTDYLNDNGVDICPLGECEGKDVADSTGTCEVAVKAKYELLGLTISDYTADLEYSFRAAIATGINVAVTQIKVTSVIAVLLRRSSSPGLAIGVQINGISPSSHSTISNRLESDANSGGLQNRLQASTEPGMASVVVSAIKEISVTGASDTWNCRDQYIRNNYTEQCCRQDFYREPTQTAERYMWTEDGCSWSCKTHFRETTTACLTCSEYNELTTRRFKPPNSVWDDESPDCSHWYCVPGYVKSATGFSCVKLLDLEDVCSLQTRCSTCIRDEDCVWCGSSCVAGRGNRTTNEGCRYNEDGTLSDACYCDLSQCTNECQHDNCKDCAQDPYCGWCQSSETCMLGSHKWPDQDTCLQGWVTLRSSCGDNTESWLIGLICACVSMLLVGIMSCYFIIRIRSRISNPEVQSQQAAAQQEEIRRLTTRFLETFPTFKYNGSKRMPSSRPDESTNNGTKTAALSQSMEDDDGEPMCSICLGNFDEGEELRMLPCLHVFHKKCIDEWLNISHECPLCKRSVINSGNAHLCPDFVSEQTEIFRQRADGNQSSGRQGEEAPRRQASARGVEQSSVERRAHGEGGAGMEMVFAVTMTSPPQSMRPATRTSGGAGNGLNRQPSIASVSSHAGSLVRPFQDSDHEGTGPSTRELSPAATSLVRLQAEASAPSLQPDNGVHAADSEQSTPRGGGGTETLSVGGGRQEEASPEAAGQPISRYVRALVDRSQQPPGAGASGGVEMQELGRKGEEEEEDRRESGGSSGGMRLRSRSDVGTTASPVVPGAVDSLSDPPDPEDLDGDVVAV